MQTLAFMYKTDAIEQLLEIVDLDGTSGRCITGAEIDTSPGGKDALAIVQAARVLKGHKK